MKLGFVWKLCRPTNRIFGCEVCVTNTQSWNKNHFVKNLQCNTKLHLLVLCLNLRIEKWSCVADVTFPAVYLKEGYANYAFGDGNFTVSNVLFRPTRLKCQIWMHDLQKLNLHSKKELLCSRMKKRNQLNIGTITKYKCITKWLFLHLRMTIWRQ
jgi:hypothetical protein